MNTILNKIEKIRCNAVKIFQKGLRDVELGSAIKRSSKRKGDHLFIGNRKYNLFKIKDIFVTGQERQLLPWQWQ